MRELEPQGTVVVAQTEKSTTERGWNIEGPKLVLNKLSHRNLTLKLYDVVCNKLGIGHNLTKREVERFLTQSGVQVVLGEWLDRCIGWLDLLRDLNVRFVAHAHGYDISEAWVSSDKWKAAYLMLDRTDAIVTPSKVSKSRLVSIGLNPNNIHVIPYGVDVPNYAPRLPKNPKIQCIAIGRMVPKKGPLYLLDAFRRALQEHPSLELDYIGTGPLLAAAYEFIDIFKLHSKVRLHGAQPNGIAIKLLQDSDIFLQHSVTDPLTGDQEGLPVAILEAMALGKPVVSTIHAGIPEAVEHERTGLLSHETDTTAMAVNIVRLAMDPTLRQSYGALAWQRCKESFSWECERTALRNVLGLQRL